MFEQLSEKLAFSIKQLSGKAHITEINISSIIKEIRKILLEADVNYRIAKIFTDIVKDRALGEKVIGSLKPEQVFVKIMQEELAKMLGGQAKQLNLSANPTIIMVAGLQGSGKTTFCAKLAHYLKSDKNKKPLLIAGDVYRPAAIEQLHILGKQIDVDVYSEQNEKDVQNIVSNALKFAKNHHHDLILIDTAGRLSVDENLMQEIKLLKNTFNPQEVLFVIDSMIGQEAVNTAQVFNNYLDFSGIVLTKLDGDTRGGAALSVKYTINKPIVFISNGEKIETLELFYPDRLAQRILGMGDIVSLVEKAEKHFNEEEAKKLENKIKKNRFDFEDFKQQIQSLKKMGNMKDMLSMVPGLGTQLKNIDIDNTRFIQIEAIINSMTMEERQKPEVLNQSRKMRIAKGCGKSINEINNFINQFEQMKKMMGQYMKMGSMPNLGSVSTLSKFKN